MTQNIYENPDFFTGYSQLQRSRQGLDGAPEWPALRAQLTAMEGLRVVDLGCGYGWFCRWAAAEGATEVLGVAPTAPADGQATAADDTPCPACALRRASKSSATSTIMSSCPPTMRRRPSSTRMSTVPRP